MAKSDLLLNVDLGAVVLEGPPRTRSGLAHMAAVVAKRTSREKSPHLSANSRSSASVYPDVAVTRSSTLSSLYCTP